MVQHKNILKMMICTFYDPLLAIKHQAIWLLVNISYGTIVILYYCIVFVTLCCSSVTLRAVGALQFQIPVHDLCILFLTVKLTLTSQSQSRYTTFYFVNVSHSVFHHIPQISSFNALCGHDISSLCLCGQYVCECLL